MQTQDNTPNSQPGDTAADRASLLQSSGALSIPFSAQVFLNIPEECAREMAAGFPLFRRLAETPQLFRLALSVGYPSRKLKA